MSALPERVAIIANDPISGEGAAAYLRGTPRYAVMAPSEVPRADVLLVIVPEVREKTLADLARIRRTALVADVRVVLVADRIEKAELGRLGGFGLSALLYRGSATREKILDALAARAPSAEPEDARATRLADEFRTSEGEARYPRGFLDRHRLQSREVEILGLLADGFGTVEIADRMAYSERTIKNIISTLLVRFDLRNRSHAVAYALRTGII
ncbi:LuxR C-terminal-related transcriptional regulator [Amycolatopsis sp. FU40]|uniref:helix-turn-helix transcriptional regulator n=1 Tax=Amycolatopsis sp. FU40 TaxID=2914159 RepID=UPI001EFF9CE4|nr:LuxR C-terminal-related transcriptional regulator [Amycolatopsis sp. FU40]UKD51790.1 LuxR C-terminal-related transcriptional regulator [Amycolatopsis sp. FU40]